MVLVGLLFLAGAFLKHKVDSMDYFEVFDFSGGPLVLRWTKVGYPAVLRWHIKNSPSIQVIFYQTLVPEYNLRSPEILLPATVKDGDYLPVILIRKKWFPLLLRRLKKGEKFVAVVRLVVKKNGRFFVYKAKAPILFKGSVFFEEVKK